MWQAEIRVDLSAIAENVARLRAGTAAEVMAVVKANAYGHGMVDSARAALAGGATWLGVCTVDEALGLRDAGINAPILSWLWAPGAALASAIAADVDLSVASLEQLDEVVEAVATAERPARVHLKIDTGLSRSGAGPTDWPALVEASAKAQADGDIDVGRRVEPLGRADDPGNESIDRQLADFRPRWTRPLRAGIQPRYRHLANSAATLTRPDTHFDLVRPGLAIYGLSPIPSGEPIRAAAGDDGAGAGRPDQAGAGR